MSCLAHNKRFRSEFHNILNELRNEKCLPLSIVRIIPSKCCTCNDENNETMEDLVLKNENQMIKLKNLLERINREKQMNSKLILSFNRFQNLIEENRTSPPTLEVQRQRKFSSSDSNSSTDCDDDEVIPMDTSKARVTPRKYQKKKIKKPSKPVESGTFVFLPYVFDGKPEKTKPSYLLEVAKKLQRGRFISRQGHIALLEKQYDVCINMLTPKTSKSVNDALENAKKGLENLTIYSKKTPIPKSDKESGEWILIRPKKSENQTNKPDFEHLLDEITNRWENCLKIKKRKSDEADNSDDLSIPTKK